MIKKMKKKNITSETINNTKPIHNPFLTKELWKASWFSLITSEPHKYKTVKDNIINKLFSGKTINKLS